MAILLAIWAMCFLSMTSHGAWGAAEVQQILIPKNDNHVPIPCVGLQPDERPSLLYWFIGETWEVAKDSLVLRYSDPSVDQNYTVNIRYSLSHGFGLVIGKLDTTDSGRYWCRVIRAAEGQESIEAADVTVFVRDLLPGPVIWWDSSGSPISKVNVMEHQILNCSVNNVYPNPDLTWSFIGCPNTANRSMVLFTSNQQSTYDVFSKTYHVTKRAYFGALDLKTDDNCEFECVAKGVAISNGSSSTVVEIFATGQQPESKSPGTTLAFIIMAIILIICCVALVYFMYRVRRLPQRRIVKYEKQATREPTGTPDEKTGLFMDFKSNEMQHITGDGSTQWTSRRSLEDYKKLFSEAEPIGDIKQVIGNSHGLLLATPKTVIRYTNRQNSKPVICTKEKFSGDVTSIVLHPQSETLIVGLRTSEKTKIKTNVKASLIFVDLNSGNYEHKVELNKFTSPKVTVDGAGAIFVGEFDGKRLCELERHGKTPLLEYTLDIDTLKNIAGYGWRHLFIVNGKYIINKYIFKRTDGCLDLSKIKDCITLNPAQGFGEIGEIVVFNHRLYVVNGTKILTYDVEVFERLHTFETEFPNLHGLCFFGMTGVALYSTEHVQVYEIEKKKKEEGNSSAMV